MMKIRLGYYQPGDQILTKPICDLFDLSNSTVRNALKLLEQERYISLSKNQRAIVIWNHDDGRPLPEDLFIDRHTLTDLNSGSALFQTEILWQGLCLTQLSELDELKKLPRHLACEEPVLYLIKRISQQLGNPLLMELLRDITLFTSPTTYLYFLECPEINHRQLNQIYQGFLQAIELCKRRAYGQAHSLLSQQFDLFGQMPVSVNQERIHPAVRSFQWGKANIGLALSSQLIARIHEGIYPANTYLPSAQALAKEYSVSKMTIRRMIWMLNSLGVTETVNGVGTRVLSPAGNAEHVQWNNPDMKKNMLLFLYALQFLLVTCKRVTEEIFRKIPEEELLHMAQEMEEGAARRYYHLAFSIWLNRLIAFSHLESVRDIYSYLNHLLIWGIPLRYTGTPSRLLTEVQGMIDALKRGDRELFASVLEQYCYAIFSQSRRVLIDLGIAGAEETAVPILGGAAE
jgi:DNA-binding FadR family transcriptional regulator